jgi:predicted nucleic acid-binding protein
MELVVDANVLVAAFLRAATTRELLLNERLLLSSPEWSLIETERVLATPQFRRRLGGLTTAEVRSVLSHITSNIRIVSAAAYHRSLTDAERLAPDPADAPYLALALHLGVPLWSNDSALKQQDAVPVYTTHELIEVLRRQSQ